MQKAIPYVGRHLVRVCQVMTASMMSVVWYDWVSGGHMGIKRMSSVQFNHEEIDNQKCTIEFRIDDRVS